MLKDCTRTIMLTIAAVVMCTTTVAFAQQDSPARVPQLQQQQPVNVDDATLEKFVAATKKMGKIREEYSQKLRSAESKPEQMELKKEAQGKMMKALKDENLDPRTYNRIVHAVKQDPKLRKKVQSRIRQ